MFFCIPILFGCQTKVKPEDNQTLRVCPRCHNASVFAAKATMWFELFFIPLIPFSRKHIWICNICQWTAPILEGQANLPAGQELTAAQGWEPPNRPGYQPEYLQQSPSPKKE
ncbi:hypothetical protein BDQ12DRAFT_676724 [Crucibulum laeve]|uniref:Zinc-ribbon 15 domain-containing protein n=1 Tax=Crucibulum laeve TaxID=68775 RepID=A0A5C3ME93_9AGAR|nr:hypothetical protein BDQ12DRAFT_676724 [Crucibulum laeve]